MLKFKRKAAVFTICRNEALFLPLWLAYYRQHFSDEDIYILDHKSTDGSTDFVPNRIVIDNELTQDNAWLIKVTCDFQQELLKTYASVLFANADEFVVPTTSPLRDYISNNSQEIVRCHGYEVLHMLDEAPLDKGKKVLHQRGFWYENSVYNKPLLGKVPIDWTGGWHNARNHQGPPDAELKLVHLHRMDYPTCLARHKKTSSEPIYRPDLDEKKWGWHHFIHKDEEFAKWFYCIPAAKTLDAERSLSMYTEAKQKSFDEIYSEAKGLVQPIPSELQVI